MYLGICGDNLAADIDFGFVLPGDTGPMFALNIPPHNTHNNR
jgi:hypothetical protein